MDDSFGLRRCRLCYSYSNRIFVCFRCNNFRQHSHGKLRRWLHRNGLFYHLPG